ncbi:hypothetical protein [Wolbachia endosymbiont of Folsomia candida]|uniref:hypothetical protein n=1 Tax=Wolbachia endosymbiont of Folsomia candida TaxID=169402 RepID=UPI000A8AACD4|nr:hypothetical protein [Wolbachia endosymbiont of Folsomia candida]APR99059.1 hypothetical protein ASM33_07725 [Wolbachia endosymbiont of Folsomia candida]
MKSTITQKAHASINIDIENNNTNTNINNNNVNTGTGNSNNAGCINKCVEELNEFMVKYSQCVYGCNDSNKGEGYSYDGTDIL